MSLQYWSFSVAISCATADGYHTFYRIEGRYTLATDLYGFAPMPVTGEGATPELALADAMRRAQIEDDRRVDIFRETQIAIMRSPGRR